LGPVLQAAGPVTKALRSGIWSPNRRAGTTGAARRGCAAAPIPDLAGRARAASDGRAARSLRQPAAAPEVML